MIFRFDRCSPPQQLGCLADIVKSRLQRALVDERIRVVGIPGESHPVIRNSTLDILEGLIDESWAGIGPR